MNIREESIKNNFKYFGGISIAYGVLFAFCMYRNLFGATFLLYALSTVFVLALFLGKIEIKIKPRTKLYFAAVILCGISTCITGNEMFQLFNWVCIIGLLTMAMLVQFFDESEWDVPSYLLNTAILFFTTIGHSFLSTKETKKYIEKEGKSKNKNVTSVITGIALAVGILFIILPLLISSDMIFGSIFHRIVDAFRIDSILPNLVTALGILFTAFLGFALIYAFFYASCHVNFPGQRGRICSRYPAVTGITFAAVIGGIYAFYSVIQIVYLFLGSEGGLPEGITYSAYAHSGFWQLVAVAFLNIILVMACLYLFEENKYLKWLLTLICGCTFIMTASAAYRMYLYVSTYDLTLLRLLVFWFLAILSLIMGGVIVSIYKKGFSLVHYMVLVTVCGYLMLSFARPDYWIARYNTEHIQVIGQEDMEYMCNRLSLDAAPVIAGIDTGDDDYLDALKYNYFKTVSDNNEGIYFRKANYSRIKAKKTADRYLREHADDR